MNEHDMSMKGVLNRRVDRTITDPDSRMVMADRIAELERECETLANLVEIVAEERDAARAEAERLVADLLVVIAAITPNDSTDDIRNELLDRIRKHAALKETTR